MYTKKSHSFNTGNLIPYKWGRGYYVIPRTGGKGRAKSYGMGIAPSISEGTKWLNHLAANEDDGWEKRSMGPPWAPPARCAYRKG